MAVKIFDDIVVIKRVRWTKKRLALIGLIVFLVIGGVIGWFVYRDHEAKAFDDEVSMLSDNESPTQKAVDIRTLEKTDQIDYLTHAAFQNALIDDNTDRAVKLSEKALDINDKAENPAMYGNLMVIYQDIDEAKYLEYKHLYESQSGIKTYSTGGGSLWVQDERP